MRKFGVFLAMIFLIIDAQAEIMPPVSCEQFQVCSKCLDEVRSQYQANLCNPRFGIEDYTACVRDTSRWLAESKQVCANRAKIQACEVCRTEGKQGALNACKSPECNKSCNACRYGVASP